MIRITIEYSEDFRENKKPSEVYGILRDEGFNPIDIFSRHDPNRGTGRCVYFSGRNRITYSRKIKRNVKRRGFNWNYKRNSLIFRISKLFR